MNSCIKWIYNVTLFTTDLRLTPTMSTIMSTWKSVFWVAVSMWWRNL